MIKRLQHDPLRIIETFGAFLLAGLALTVIVEYLRLRRVEGGGPINSHVLRIAGSYLLFLVVIGTVIAERADTGFDFDTTGSEVDLSTPRLALTYVAEVLGITGLLKMLKVLRGRR